MASSTRSKRQAIALLTALGTLCALAVVGVPATAVAVAPLGAKSVPAGTAHARLATATPRTTRAATAAAIAGDFGSIYTSHVPELENSGWAACATPITWSVDTRELTAAQAADQIENLTWAFTTWSAASGLTFQFDGQTPVDYSDGEFSMKPADGSAFETRHIYLAFVSADASTRLDNDTVGLGSPNKVIASTKEITGGLAVFSTQHVLKAADRPDRSLFLHELGHVLGLAHASLDANIMYSMVTDTITLGTGDLNGIKAISKPCAS